MGGPPTCIFFLPGELPFSLLVGTAACKKECETERMSARERLNLSVSDKGIHQESGSQLQTLPRQTLRAPGQGDRFILVSPFHLLV